MKKLLIPVFLFFAGMPLYSQSLNPQYDSTLAKSLGADDYGMKSYILVILKTGPNKMSDQAKLDILFDGHMKNIQKMANLGKLIVAGPFGENKESYRGIFILNVNTLEEARTLLESDPTIREKVLEPEFYQWYGSAALGEYLKVHEKIEKKSF
jgi:uncharacterized protein YciI